MFQRDVGIDLGSSTVLIYVKGRGIVLREPSVVALDRSSGQLLAVGAGALKMVGRTPDGIAALRPIRDGVVNDSEMTERMLQHFLKRVHAYGLFRPNLLINIPSDATDVEEKAVIEAGMRAGAGKVYLMESPMAAALGCGLDIDKPQGSMVIDIGGGSTGIAVMSMGNVISSTSVRVGGEKFNEAIIRYIRQKYKVLIGVRTAEELKVNIGCAAARPEPKTMQIIGRSLVNGLPEALTISSEEMPEAMEDVIRQILNAIQTVLERVDPELMTDISQTGVLLTGGGCLLWGFDKMLTERTGLPARIADDAVSCVVYGTGKALDRLSERKDGMIHIFRRHTLEEPTES